MAIIIKRNFSLIIFIHIAVCIFLAHCHQSKEQQLIFQTEKSQKVIQDNCKQYFPRLFYSNNTLMDSSRNTEKVQYIIRFNTNSPCTKSFVVFQQLYKVTKVYCETEKMEVTQQTTFIQYIQSCRVHVIRQIGNFSYSCYGNMERRQKSQSNDQQSVQKDKNTAQNLVHIPQINKPLKLIATADWGPIRQRPYISIYPSLEKLLEDKGKYEQMNGLIIAGDIGYDLHTNQCEQFLIFMQELSAISRVWPIIPIVGNHQAFGLSYYIFQKNFEGTKMVTDQRIQVTQFWNIKIIAFNPFLEIYNQSTPEKYNLMKSAIINTVKKYKQENAENFIMLSSHYPIICSQQVFHCKQTMITISDLFNELSQMKAVDIYLGAHMHQYQRIYPYINKDYANGTESPYNYGMMVSIVEGVAGCDVGIIDQDFPVQNYSAKHSYNKTGFGVLTFSGATNSKTLNSSIQMVYQHLVTQPMLNVFDQILINGQKIGKTLNLRLVQA